MGGNAKHSVHLRAAVPGVKAEDSVLTHPWVKGSVWPCGTDCVSSAIHSANQTQVLFISVFPVCFLVVFLGSTYLFIILQISFSTIRNWSVFLSFDFRSNYFPMFSDRQSPSLQSKNLPNVKKKKPGAMQHQASVNFVRWFLTVWCLKKKKKKSWLWCPGGLES